MRITLLLRRRTSLRRFSDLWLATTCSRRRNNAAHRCSAATRIRNAVCARAADGCRRENFRRALPLGTAEARPSATPPRRDSRFHRPRQRGVVTRSLSAAPYPDSVCETERVMMRRAHETAGLASTPKRSRAVGLSGSAFRKPLNRNDNFHRTGAGSGVRGPWLSAGIRAARTAITAHACDAAFHRTPSTGETDSDARASAMRARRDDVGAPSSRDSVRRCATCIAVARAATASARRRVQRAHRERSEMIPRSWSRRARRNCRRHLRHHVRHRLDMRARISALLTRKLD